MASVLITGMSGAGTSTLLAELAARGHRTVDTDLDGWTDGDGGPGDEPRMTALLAAGDPRARRPPARGRARRRGRGPARRPPPLTPAARREQANRPDAG
ncbi:hypothetical protein [Microbacterium sp. 10M-3C3]|uniref:hypothetical protein n=1 Tax=Microbacterium sp. 10M-3C3 TaxID=2483401 RepID=UPI00197BAB86|nr:hypothetical protein [Microbacterium sp. 10M-3C3]